MSNIKTGLRYFEVADSPSFIGSSNSDEYIDLIDPSSNDEVVWIITEDNMAYAVWSYNNTENKVCETKLELNSHNSIDKAKQKACFTVIVDVNGINKAPNIVEPQITKNLTSESALDTLSGDQYYIFVGRDGATAGNARTTLTGRLVSNVMGQVSVMK